MNIKIKDFISFLDASNSRFQAGAEVIRKLEKAGFSRLNETDTFALKAGGKYYIHRHDTAVIAFVKGRKPLAESGFLMASSHIDSPALKLKPQSIKTDRGITRIGVEVYGGPIVHTWLDRELGISGQVLYRSKDGTQASLLDFQRPVAIIPNAAIHMNREINKGFQYNPQTHLQAILSAAPQDSDDPLKTMVAKELSIKEENILEMDLYLYDLAGATLVGDDQSMLTSGRLDNLAMTHAILSAIMETKKPESTALAAFFDHEEIGSSSPQGASSSFLGEILERISLAESTQREDYLRALRNSFMISADMAHALHPSYPEKYDPDYSPLMNKGVVIKRNANLKYASTSVSSQRFIAHCEKVGVAHQEFLVRSDMPCGSTVGPIVASLLGIHTVDIGNPMWAMHSIRETAGVQDHLDLIRILTSFFSE